MISAANMENGPQNGIHSNHDRDTKAHGANGAVSVKREASLEKGKALAYSNGGYDGAEGGGPPQPDAAGQAGGPGKRNKMNNLPEELIHITENFIPLNFLLMRLAQKSHNMLQDKILQLAQMPVPQAAVNGGSDSHGAPPDDTSAENLAKKASLLHFIQDMHAKWVKALVITEWSRKAELVSKLIDLKAHLNLQMRKYDEALDYIIDVKRSLAFARLPDPDLKTALQVLSTGEAPWMPEFNYIEPPVLTPQEQLKWIDNLNTLLSIRLSLDDHDRIPAQFQDYDISSGRVTFKVKGEFEVDLTIADEDFDKQFWFIDFRFLFSPAPSNLSEPLRAFLEAKVNEALAADGLEGCYRFLHEFVLTHKINELRRQALELSRGRWIDTLKIERLNRAISIQYWAARYPPGSPKSWVIIGVDSGRRHTAAPDPRSTSQLSLRWFRDNKEVKDAWTPFGGDEVSAETILKRVVGRHVEHILSTIHDRMRTKPRFSKREASMSLHIDRDEPMESYLKVQLTSSERVTAKIDPISGHFAMSPHSRMIIEGEARLNYMVKDPAEEGMNAIEGIRCVSAVEEMKRRGRSMGWTGTRQPGKVDIKSIVHAATGSREPFQPVWFRREGWDPHWYLMISLSLSGDKWWLIELGDSQPDPQVKSYLQLPLTSTHPTLSDAFFSNLSTFATGIMAQLIDVGVLRAKRIAHVRRALPNHYLSSQVKIPTLFVRLADLLPSSESAPGRANKKHWAMDFVRITFRGVERPSARSQAGHGSSERRLGIIAEARLSVTDKQKFSLLKGAVDHDVAFFPQVGQFLLRLRAEVGRSVIDTLASRLQAIDRLVDFVDGIRHRGNGVQCQSVTLRKVVFTYGDTSSEPAAGAASTAVQPKKWRVVLDWAHGDKTQVTLEKGNPHLRVLDMLGKLVNSSLGFESLPFWLDLTLPLLRGLDELEDSWESIQNEGKGNVAVFHKSLGWLTIRFELPGPGTARRQLGLDLRLRLRGGEPWWWITRSGSDKEADDEASKALQAIWNARGDGWRGLKSGAAASPSSGIENLLSKTSEVVKALSSRPGPAPGAKGAGAGSRSNQSIVILDD